ncbi:hypothetical protein BIW11_10337 [Tropilaelaps mercedesae]|uniref:Uncharacterized protein n=1 Tax=Tropilaelaps mercedesae TaxID=418985 RepID=A0A1V9XGG1_9ACAR|nr:hypothetical protein BIW11_10337 [Tropilaelaps mercedesae]
MVAKKDDRSPDGKAEHKEKQAIGNKLGVKKGIRGPKVVVNSTSTDDSGRRAESPGGSGPFQLQSSENENMRRKAQVRHTQDDQDRKEQPDRKLSGNKTATARSLLERHAKIDYPTNYNRGRLSPGTMLAIILMAALLHFARVILPEAVDYSF